MTKTEKPFGDSELHEKITRARLVNGLPLILSKHKYNKAKNKPNCKFISMLIVVVIRKQRKYCVVETSCFLKLNI